MPISPAAASPSGGYPLCCPSGYSFRFPPMAMDLPFDPALLGFRLSGDLGGVTLYQTKRGKTVAYPAAPPKSPPTNPQLAHRLRFANAARNWSSTAPHVRQDYEYCSMVLSLPATGLNLWMFLSFTQDAGALATFNHQARLNLPMPPPV